MGLLHPGAGERQPASSLRQRRAAGPTPSGHRRSHGHASAHGNLYPAARGWQHANTGARGCFHANAYRYENIVACAYADTGAYVYAHDNTNASCYARPCLNAKPNPNASNHTIAHCRADGNAHA